MCRPSGEPFLTEASRTAHDGAKNVPRKYREHSERPLHSPLNATHGLLGAGLSATARDEFEAEGEGEGGGMPCPFFK